MTIIVVACFVFALGLFAFIPLPGVATLGGLERVVVRAFGVRERHGEKPLQFGRAALRARGDIGATNERLELVVAGFADEVENWHDRMGECS